jgi:hypothetical protein
LDFIRRVDSLYDSTIKRIFLVVDNISIHKAKKVREILSRYHRRITLVFLPIKSPELNLIEVKDGCGCKEKLSIIVHLLMNMTLGKQ